MLFDSDVLIWALRGNKKAHKLLVNAPVVYISIVNHMEILRGAHDKKESALFKSLVAETNIKVLLVNESISSKAFYLIENYSLSHGLDIPDAFIAATCDIHELTLFTGNVKDYRFMPGLNLKAFKA